MYVYPTFILNAAYHNDKQLNSCQNVTLHYVNNSVTQRDDKNMLYMYIYVHIFTYFCNESNNKNNSNNNNNNKYLDYLLTCC